MSLAGGGWVLRHRETRLAFATLDCRNQRIETLREPTKESMGPEVSFRQLMSSSASTPGHVDPVALEGVTQLYTLANSGAIDSDGVFVYLNRQSMPTHFRNEFFERPHKLAESWVGFVPQYESLARSSDLLLGQFKELANRLEILYRERQRIRRKLEGYYSDDSYLQPIDADIRKLSSLGDRLRGVASRFFAAVKQEVIDAERDKEVMAARSGSGDGTSGSDVQSSVERSLADTVSQTEDAVRELQRSMDQVQLSHR